MKVFAILLGMSLILPITSDTPKVTESKEKTPKSLTPQQAQFQKDVMYVVNNAKKAFISIDRIDSKLDNTQVEVSKIVASNHKLWSQNDSLRIVQNRILSYALKADERATKAEKEDAAWHRVLNDYTIFGIVGTLILTIASILYNRYLYSKYKHLLIHKNYAR